MSQFDLGGATIHYDYDGVGQKTAQTSSGRGSAGLAQNLKYTYDGAGMLIRIDDLTSKQITTYRYDVLGNRVSEKVVQQQAIQVQGVEPFPTDAVALRQKGLRSMPASRHRLSIALLFA